MIKTLMLSILVFTAAAPALAAPPVGSGSGTKDSGPGCKVIDQVQQRARNRQKAIVDGLIGKLKMPDTSRMDGCFKSILNPGFALSLGIPENPLSYLGNMACSAANAKVGGVISGFNGDVNTVLPGLQAMFNLNNTGAQSANVNDTSGTLANALWSQINGGG